MPRSPTCISSRTGPGEAGSPSSHPGSAARGRGREAERELRQVALGRWVPCLCCEFIVRVPPLAIVGPSRETPPVVEAPERGRPLIVATVGSNRSAPRRSTPGGIGVHEVGRLGKGQVARGSTGEGVASAARSPRASVRLGTAPRSPPGEPPRAGHLGAAPEPAPVHARGGGASRGAGGPSVDGPAPLPEPTERFGPDGRVDGWQGFTALRHQLQAVDAIRGGRTSCVSAPRWPGKLSSPSTRSRTRFDPGGAASTRPPSRRSPTRSTRPARTTRRSTSGSDRRRHDQQGGRRS